MRRRREPSPGSAWEEARRNVRPRHEIIQDVENAHEELRLQLFEFEESLRSFELPWEDLLLVIGNYADPTAMQLLTDPTWENFTAWYDRNPGMIWEQVNRFINSLREHVDRLIEVHQEASQPETPAPPPLEPHSPPAEPELPGESHETQAPRHATTNPAEPVLPTQRFMTTAYSDAYCLVDLGKLHPKVKGGARGDHFDHELIGEWVRFVNEQSQIFTSPENKKSYHWLYTFNLNAPVVDNSASARSILDINSGGRNSIGKFNSVHQLFWASSRVMGATSTTDNQFWPGYDFSTRPGPRDPNQGHALIALRKQHLHMRFKNVSQRDTGATPALTHDQTSVHMRLMIVQAKKDIHQMNAGTQNTIPLDYLITGWQSAYDAPATTGNDNPIEKSKDQPLWMSLRDNEWFQTHWDVVDVKKFTLCPGQEAKLTASIMQPQILSYQWMMRAIPSTTTNYFLPVVIKKGEQHVIWFQHGQVGISNDDDNSVQLKSTKLAVWTYHSWEAARVPQGNTKRTIARDVQSYSTYVHGMDPDTQYI